ncbi:PEP-CTERM protein-sorting domain-containing protein [Polynucleobacter kasalickyi]|uniref:PEP-CTERM protein-sorting domain-containing protein n=1 Tax=Polynucleobacter kasalickyi TaxID=1938817 RepID=A0A1W2BMV0_9BURK|nr:PEP-CTERM protein-sorting domain-containing protein [Polynucleobacter kasalickyi]
MNFALPATLILLILLPGFIVRSRFKRVKKQSLDFSPFGLAFTEGICWAIFLLQNLSNYQKAVNHRYYLMVTKRHQNKLIKVNDDYSLQ